MGKTEANNRNGNIKTENDTSITQNSRQNGKGTECRLCNLSNEDRIEIENAIREFDKKQGGESMEKRKQSKVKKSDNKPKQNDLTTVTVKDDGSICIGDDCIVITPTKEGNVHIITNEETCPPEVRDTWTDKIVTMVARGGRTIYETKSKVKEEEEDSTIAALKKELEELKAKQK